MFPVRAGTICCVKQQISRKRYHTESFIDQAYSAKMASGYWLRSFFVDLELGRYPAILTSRLINNPYMYQVMGYSLVFWARRNGLIKKHLWQKPFLLNRLTAWYAGTQAVPLADFFWRGISLQNVIGWHSMWLVLRALSLLPREALSRGRKRENPGYEVEHALP